jgi:hypothetical protein
MPTREPKRREKQAKSFAAPIFPRTAVGAGGNPAYIRRIAPYPELDSRLRGNDEKVTVRRKSFVGKSRASANFFFRERRVTLELCTAAFNHVVYVCIGFGVTVNARHRCARADR